MQYYDLSPQGPNWQALDAFIHREEERHGSIRSTQGRVLLKLEGQGTSRHLVAIDETKLGILDFTLLRIKALFTPSDYKLLNIKKFIDLIPTTHGEPFSKAKAIINRKIEAPKNPSLLNKLLRLFDSLINKSTLTSPPKTSTPYASELNDFLDSLLRMQSGGSEEVTEFVNRFEHLQQVAIEHPELVDFIRDAKGLYEEKVRHALKPAEQERVPNVELTQLVMQKDDGNCLLRAISYGLNLQPDTSHASLRDQAALWLKHNWKTFQSDNIDLKGTILCQAIPDHNAVMKRDFDLFKQSTEAILQFGELAEEQKKAAIESLKEAEDVFNQQYISEDLPDDARIEKYIELTRKERMFCDNPQIIALSHFYDRPIIVYCTEENAEGIISLVRREGRGCNVGTGEPIELHFDEKRNHYNAVKSKAKIDAPSAPDSTLGKQPNLTPQKRKRGQNSPKSPKSPKRILSQVPKQKASAAPMDVEKAKAPAALLAPIGCGMQNSGNSCFLNSTVQAMRLNIPFRHFLTNQLQKVSSAPASPFLALLDLSNRDKLIVWNTMAEIKVMEVDYVKIDKRAWTDAQKRQRAQELLQKKQLHIQDRLGELLLPELLEKLVALADSRVDRKKALKPYLVNALARLYDTMEGRNTRAKVADSDEVQALRRLVTFCGFITRGEWTQEDASEFMGTLLETLDAPVFEVVPHYAYELAFPLPAAELEEIKGSFIKLEMAEAPQNTPFQGLISNNIYKTVINKQDILNTLKESDRLKVTPTEMNKIRALPDTDESLIALQSLHLKGDDIPDMLPITLSRFIREDGRSEKVGTKIPVATSIFFSLDEDPHQDIEYKLTSAVVHTGSLDSGHYRCYGRLNIGGTYEWVEFDDSDVRQNKDPKAVEEDIAQNGYVFFFERVKKS